jgi:protein SCO1/2
LLFFGFTHCPDVCPTTLATLKSLRAALADLPGFATRNQVLFVSVDPARDTPEALRTYDEYFDPDFRAATAAAERLNVLTRQLGILYARVETGGLGGYTMDHTASVLLVSPDKRLVGVFTPPHAVPELAARIRGIVDFLGGGS